MEFPVLVYKASGPHQRKGGSFDYASCASEEGLKTALSQGWFETLEEAIADKEKPALPVGKSGSKSAAWGN